MYTENRPRGSYTILDENTGYKVKRIVVNPDQTLSLQMHHRRSEHRTVVTGTANVTIGPDTDHIQTHTIQAGGYIFIPQTYIHRIANPGTEPMTFIEVQNGDYLGEDDIVRFEDAYGRIAKN